MNRDEHLARSKARALAQVDQGDLHAAYTSLASDLVKHPDTRADAVLQTRVAAGMEHLAQGAQGGLDTPEAMRRYVEGFE